jgi:hypothetical protein
MSRRFLMERRFLILWFALVLVAAAAAPSLAAPAQRVELPDTSFEFPNPCTGDLTTVTLSNQVLVIHDDIDPNLGEHTSGTITGDVSTTDGFSGRFTVLFGSNLDDISDALIQGEFAMERSLTLRDANGALLLVHSVFHVTIPPADVGELKGSVDNFTAECLGQRT